MALEIKLNQKLSQSLVMTPQLQQAIKLLQLGRHEYLEVIQKELLENPVLEDAAETDADSSNDLRNERERSASDGSRPDAEVEAPQPKEASSEEPLLSPDVDWSTYLDAGGDYGAARAGSRGGDS
ncbi:MAG: hypothetical protein KDD44_10005, partial [Bdellovibrionales bacterium]|nr:hypothetical protein [Bdellovibrionales bacterium]